MREQVYGCGLQVREASMGAATSKAQGEFCQVCRGGLLNGDGKGVCPSQVRCCVWHGLACSAKECLEFVLSWYGCSL